MQKNDIFWGASDCIYMTCTSDILMYYVQPQKLTWNLKITLGKGEKFTNDQFVQPIFGFRESFGGYRIFAHFTTF